MINFAVQQKLTQHCKATMLFQFSSVHFSCSVMSDSLRPHEFSHCHIWLFFDPTDCSLPGSSVHGILQARILEWVAMSFSRGSSQHRDQTYISCLAGRLFTAEPLGNAKALYSASARAALPPPPTQKNPLYNSWYIFKKSRKIDVLLLSCLPGYYQFFYEYLIQKERKFSYSVVSNSLWPHGL